MFYCPDETTGVVVLTNGESWYQLMGADSKILDALFDYAAGGVGIKDSPSMGVDLPKTFVLLQNCPNPFNPSTTIGYTIPDGTETLQVRLFVYDIRGRLVRILADNRHGPGHFQVHWDGRDDRGQPVASGVYLYRFETDNFASTRKMLLIR